MAIKKYTNGSWVPASFRKYGTETDTITTLPATIIGDGTPISSYTIKGNMEQNGTPTPSSPIYPSECGDLATSGEHAGQYKLPIALGSTTTDIYLGEVQSTRRIKKLVLDGTEDWSVYNSGASTFFHTSVASSGLSIIQSIVSSHFVGATISTNNTGVGIQLLQTQLRIRPESVASTTITDFKAFLAQQYANSTPVTVWYTLTNPITGIVNEPLRKIGDYVDSVSGTGLATSGAGQAFDINTTLKPSEVDMTYHGWHEHDDTKYST